MSNSETKPAIPEPWQVLDSIIKYGEPGPIASRLHVSEQLIRAWKREPEGSAEYESTGRLSPLDRLTRIIEFIKTRDEQTARAYPIGHYVAAILGGVFVPLPPVSSNDDSEFLANISAILKETGEVVERARRAYLQDTPGRVTMREQREINAEIAEAIGALHRLQQWTERNGGNR